MKATFSMRPAKVREEGKTVEKDVEWVEVSGGPLAGDVVSRRVRDADRQRFKAEYRAFLAAQKPTKDGAAAFVEAGRGAAKRLFKRD